MIAVCTGNLVPFGMHNLITDKFQRSRQRSIRLPGIFIRDRRTKLLMINSCKCSHLFSALKGKFLFCHQERCCVISTCRQKLTANRKADGEIVRVCYGLFVHQIGSITLAASQIGTQHIGFSVFWILHLSGKVISALCQLQLFKRFNHKPFFIGKAQGACVNQICTAFLQTKEHQSIIVAIIYHLLHITCACRINVCCRINFFVLTYPVDREIFAILLNLQSLFDLLLREAVVKCQQDIRCFICTGIHCDLFRYSSSVSKNNRLFCLQSSGFLIVFRQSTLCRTGCPGILLWCSGSLSVLLRCALGCSATFGIPLRCALGRTTTPCILL